MKKVILIVLISFLAGYQGGYLMQPEADLGARSANPAPKIIIPKLETAPVKPPVITVSLPDIRTLSISKDNYNDENRQCLALNVYFESKNQSPAGQTAVGLVTLNRVASHKFPNTICKVVKQARNWKGNPIRNKCQFSWWCDGKHDKPIERQAWLQAQEIANALLDNWVETDDITYGALWYHANYVNPRWNKDYTKTTEIGDHIFYGK